MTNEELADYLDKVCVRDGGREGREGGKRGD